MSDNPKTIKGYALLQPLAMAIGMTVTSTAAVAEDFLLEEIIVTAQKRAQSLQDVPVSVNAVTGKQMAESGITNLQDMQAMVPNLTLNQTGIGTNIGIRGIASGTNQAFEQSVGMYVDGVAYPRAQLTRVPMFDMERVEVVRGPQSILFGKNSIAGAVSLITAKPSDEFEASISGRFEPEHDEQEVQLMVNGALTENLAGRLALYKREIDGWVENDLSGDGQTEEEVVRGSLLWDVSDDLTVTFKAELGQFDVSDNRNIDIYGTEGTVAGMTWLEYANVLDLAANGAAASPASDPTLNYSNPTQEEFSKNDTKNYTLQVDYNTQLGTLTSVTSYVGYEYTELCDCDFFGTPVFNAELGEDYDQYSQEFRLVSPGGETLDYIVGAFLQKTDMDYTDSIDIPTDSVIPQALLLDPAVGAAGALMAGSSTVREFEQEADMAAVFAQVTWNINDELRLILGGRYTQEDKEATRTQTNIAGPLGDGGQHPLLPAGFTVLDALIAGFNIEENNQNGKRDESAFTPLVTLQWDLTEDIMGYASYTEGFKSGGFDLRSNADPVAGVGFPGGPTGAWEFEEEKAKSIELGAKISLLDGAAELNAALYRTEYTDLQVSIFDGTLGFNVDNAGEAITQGLELDGRWRVSEGLTLSGALAYLDFEYEKFPSGQCYFGQTDNIAPIGDGLCDYKGKTERYTSEWTASLTADYIYPVGDRLEARATLDLQYSDEFLIAPTIDPGVSQDAYTKVNLRLALSSVEGDWEVALMGKNLTDEEVTNYAAELPTAASLTGGAASGYFAFMDRPRTVELQGRYRF